MSAIKEAYDALHSYFGLRGRDDYLNSAQGKSPGAASGGKSSPIADTYGLLYGDDDKNPTIEDIVKKMCEIEMEVSKDIFCVTPFKDGLENAATQPFPINGAANVGYNEQGVYPAKYQGSKDIYTVTAIDPEKFNGDDSRIDVVQVFPVKGVPELSDTEILTLYLSTITSLNMSLAVPYVDVTVSTQGDTSLSAEPFSFGKFLDAPAADAATNADFLDQSFVKGEFKERTVASMEIFTSPQTLVNAENVRYNENVASGGPIDRFRPFLNLESIEFHVVPANAGLISFKTANAKIRLFDRGRLSDIAPIVAPSRFGVVKFDIEYGWSHPGGVTKTRSRLSDSSDDRIGQLIDAMRIREAYQVVNSNFSFEQDGSVAIDLKLSMLGSSAMVSKNVAFSSDDADMADLEKQLRELNRLLSGAPKGINVPSTLTGGADTLMKISKESRKELTKFINSLKQKGGTLGSAGTIAAKLLIGKGNTLDKLQENRTESVRKYITKLASSPDPFLRHQVLPSPGISSEEIKSGRYASLGTVLTTTLGPIFQDFGDVIFVFSAFNRDAGALYDHNIAQFPVKLRGKGGKNEVTLERILTKTMKTQTKITPEGFIELLNENFILRPGYDAYGLNEVYAQLEVSDKDDHQKDALVKNLSKDSDKPEQQLAKEEKLQTVLKKVYGGRHNPTFTQPRLTLKIDTKSSAGGRPVIRVTVFDQAASTVGDIQQMFDDVTSNGFFEKEEYPAPKPENKARGCQHKEVSEQAFQKLQSMNILEQENGEDLLKKLEKKANEDNPQPAIKIVPDIERENLIQRLRNVYFIKEFNAGSRELRNIFYDFFPTLIFGSMGSGIISAQLSSNQNDALTTIMLQKQPEQVSGLPMLIHPTQLSMEVFGTPLFKYSQKFFVDFGTGTSADNFYVVTGVDMSFSPGEFKCSLKMTLLDAFGKLMKTKDTIYKTMIASLKHEERAKKQAPKSTPKGGTAGSAAKLKADAKSTNQSSSDW